MEITEEMWGWLIRLYWLACGVGAAVCWNKGRRKLAVVFGVLAAVPVVVLLAALLQVMLLF